MSDEPKQRIFSGVQPTGQPHLGNYLGALRNWTRLQHEYDAVYCIVDLHAMTVEYDPADLEAARVGTARVLLALGIDPTRSLLYTQSQVPAHTELSWILSTLMPLGVLNRMTQFKDKTTAGHASNLGLYAYPVLMAADILLYRANLVPVGDDQRQHLEVTRDVAQRFNNRFGEVFPIPEAYIPETSARVMSLVDPTAKMSKSDVQQRATISILDGPDVIRKRIKGATTDSDPIVRYDTETKPGISNLLEIMAACTDRSIDDLVKEYGDGGYGAFKAAVAEAVIEELAPVRAAYNTWEDHDVRDVLRASGEKARELSEEYQREVYRAVGLKGY